MEEKSYSKVEINLALRKLKSKKMISQSMECEFNNEYYFAAVRLTSDGEKWLFDNENFLLKTAEPAFTISDTESGDTLPF